LEKLKGDKKQPLAVWPPVASTDAEHSGATARKQEGQAAKRSEAAERRRGGWNC